MKKATGVRRKEVAFSDSRGEKMALDLFHVMADRVPAYKDFLHKHEVDRNAVKTYSDLQRLVPVIDKKNYLSQYSLADLCFEGDIFQNNIISVSSGSTGTPFFWPRGKQQDIVDSAMLANIYDNLGMNKKKTLLVLCFSMGTWIAGTLVMNSSINYANAGNPISVLTPGIEKNNAIDVVLRLGKDYDQVVVGGYPPFAKDLIEEGRRMGVDWTSLHTKFVMGGESFSEEWRDYVLEMVGSIDPYYSTANIFGAADIGIVGYETPTSILVRRLYNGQKEVMTKVFGTEVLPSIVQYDPTKRHFEKVGEELVVSSNSGIPLVRYNLKDTGGMLSYRQLTVPLGDVVSVEAKKHGVELDSTLPFIYLNGRKDFAITLYSVNIYPENIKAALIDPSLRTFTTGRFTMASKTDESMDQSFEINVELAKDAIATTDDQQMVEKVILRKLCELNGEFRRLFEAVEMKARPQVRLVTFGDTNYFVRGIKHKWAKKNGDK